MEDFSSPTLAERNPWLEQTTSPTTTEISVKAVPNETHQTRFQRNIEIGRYIPCVQNPEIIWTDLPANVDLSRHSHHLRESDGAVPIAWLLVSGGGLIAGGIGVRQGRKTCRTAVDPMEVLMLTLRYEPNEPDWKRAHSKSACLLRHSFPHRSWSIASIQCFKIGGTEGRSSHATVTIARTETTLQVSRLTLNGTCVQEAHQYKHCRSYKDSCWRLGTHLRVFQTGSSSRALFNEITNWESREGARQKV